jgi:hypothetical protein
MAYYPKYRIEWADYLNYQWKADIEDTTYHASPISLIADGNPLKIEFLSTTDEIYNDPIKGSKAELKVLATSDFQLFDLYAIQDQQFRVSIYGNGSLFWQGFIFTDQYSEPYNLVPYTVTISATDQLGILKNILYDNAGTYYNGRIRESKIVLDILAKIGLSQFTEYVNLYEVGMANGTTDSPFDQISIDADVFQDMSCYAVLGEVLRKYNAIIRNIAGQMVIYRPVELSSNTVYGRVFTGETTKTGTSMSTAQLINRSGSASEIRDVNGGSMIPKAPAKKITADLDCGNKDSWLDNWEIRSNLFTGSDAIGWSIQYWSKFGGPDPTPISKSMPGETSGALINGHNNYPTLNNYLYQEFGTWAVSSENIFAIEFDYLTFNTSIYTRTGQHIYVKVISSDGHYLKIKDDSYCEWAASDNKIDIPLDIIAGSSGWYHFRRQIVGIPSNGPYTAYLFAISDTYTDIIVGFRNVQFYNVSTNATVFSYPIYETRGEWWNLFLDPAGYIRRSISPQIMRYGRKTKYTENPEITLLPYEATNAINGIEANFNYILGDVQVTDVNIGNIIEQFSGSLARISSSETLSSAILRFVTQHAYDYPGVILTKSGNNILFTASTPGTDFAYSIGFSSATLTGTVSTLTANAAAVARIDNIVFTDSGSGSCYITVDGKSASMPYYGASITNTIDNFITNQAGIFTGILLTRNGTDSIDFEAVNPNIDFTGVSSAVDNGIPGSVSTTQSCTPGTARVDQLALSGSNGTADITFSISKTLDIAVGTTLTPTTVWNTRGGSENKPLLNIIGDEIAAQMSRPRQMVAGWPIREGSRTDNTIHLDILGRIEDIVNEDPDTNNSRMFVFNRGTFDGLKRKWEADFIEII